MAAARKSSRYGHRDATMILIGYRHGLQASELCDLQWSQIELTTGRLHVRRAKNGSPSVHPMQGDEIRALRPAARAGAVLARLHDRAGRADDARRMRSSGGSICGRLVRLCLFDRITQASRFVPLERRTVALPQGSGSTTIMK